jgi:hypothetical protein
VRETLQDLVSGFDVVSLATLDKRAALLRRVDHKYPVPRDAFKELARTLRDEYEVLEIDGRRTFHYSTTYFDTPELRCFVDHVEKRIPRFKARSRLYQDSHRCVFEVKLKRASDETDKRQIDYAEEDRQRLTEEALRCVHSALADAGLQDAGDLSATLTTSFERATFAGRQGSERLTCDSGVTLTGPDGRPAAMRQDLVLVETKSEDGESPADRELRRMGIEPISVSKYRVGMSLAGAARGFGAQPGGQLFE